MVLSRARDAASSARDSVSSSVSDTASSVSSSVSDTASSVSSSVSDTTSSVSDSVSDTTSSVSDSVSDTVSSVTGGSSGGSSGGSDSDSSDDWSVDDVDVVDPSDSVFASEIERRREDTVSASDIEGAINLGGSDDSIDPSDTPGFELPGMEQFEDLIPEFEQPEIEVPEFTVPSVPDLPNIQEPIGNLQNQVSQQIGGVADLVASIPAALAGEQRPEDEERGGGSGGMGIGQLAVGGTAIAAVAFAAYRRFN